MFHPPAWASKRRLPLLAAVATSCVAGLPAAADASTLGVVSPAPGRVDVFGRDAATGKLRWATWSETTKTWNAWKFVGVDTIAPGSDIAAVSRDGLTLDVFYRNTAGALKRKSGTLASMPASPSSLGTNNVDGGPSAVVTGTKVQIVARNANDGNALRYEWSPSTTATTTYTNWWNAAGASPGLGTTDGNKVQVAATGDGTPDDTTPLFNTWDLTVGVDWNQFAQFQYLPGTTVGTPSVVSQSSGATDLTARTPSGGISRLSRATTTTAWPAAWTALPTPPAGQVASATPATVLYKATSTSTPVLQTWLPSTNLEHLVRHTAATGWQPVKVQPALSTSAAEPAGAIRYFGRTSGEDGWDAYFQPQNSPIAVRNHINTNVWRMHLFQGNGSPESWFQGSMVYHQLYTVDPSLLTSNPTWVMKDAQGNPLYAADGSEPHNLMAGNIFNPQYRAAQIAQLVNDTVGKRGLWLDNVNLEAGDSGLVKQLTWDAVNNRWNYPASWVGALTGVAGAGAGNYNQPYYAPSGSIPGGAGCAAVASIPAGGMKISDSCWAVAVAAMVAELRAALPADKELLSNVPWYRTQRDVETYGFITDANGLPAGGLPTVPGQSVVGSSNYLDLEGSFWTNAYKSGGTSAISKSGNGYSLDNIFRWIDAIHAAGKGFVADNWMNQARLDTPVPPSPQPDTRLLRVQEYNLAGYLIATNGKDGIGDYNPKDTLWPSITGSGGTKLYDMNIGTASALPAGVTAFSGTTGRGAKLGASGNRLWTRAFTRSDGKKVYVLLTEFNDGATPLVGTNITLTLPTGCTNMTRATSASNATFTSGTASLAPASALFLLCP